MDFAIITLFPNLFEQFITTSIIGKAVKKELIKIKVVNLRDFGQDSRKTVDSRPFGGGQGMIIKPDVAAKAIEKTKKSLKKPVKTILLTPAGKVFNQKMAMNLAKFSSLLIFCGHYEGVDERVTSFVDEQVSLGDFILTGGETAALAIIDAVTRLIPKVLPKVQVASESFFNNLLVSPVYTKPEVFKKLTVPKVLLKGDRGKIEKWRRRQRVLKTKKIRPDLFEKYLKRTKDAVLGGLVSGGRTEN